MYRIPAKKKKKRQILWRKKVKTTKMQKAVHRRIYLNDQLLDLSDLSNCATPWTAATQTSCPSLSPGVFEAALGWDFSLLEGKTLTAEEADLRYAQNSEEISEDIFFIRNAKGRFGSEKIGELAIAESMIVVRVRDAGFTTGYFVLDILERKESVTDEELELLTNLREHIVSAFSKARLLEDRKRLIDELKTAQDELVRKERLAAIGQLTAAVSHELRNPLGTIQSTFFLMKEKLKGREHGLEQAIARIQRNIDRCDMIIEEMLDYTRVKELQVKPVAVDDWISNLLEEYSIPDHISLHKKLESQQTVDIDPESFRRCVINLLDNSCQAMSDQVTSVVAGALYVESVANKTRWELNISDTGPGITPENLQKILEPLYSTKPFGVGLGLPIVKQIIDRHNGSISIKSKEGQGTRVSLWLPVEKKDASTTS